MITDKLKELLATNLQGLVNSGKLGLGGNTTSPLALDLDVPISGITPTISAVKSNTNVVQIIKGKAVVQGELIDGNKI